MKLVGVNLSLIALVIFTMGVYAADNEIYITQSGTNAQIEIDQIGSGNQVKGNEAASGTDPISAFTLTGNSQTIDINQVGDSNDFIGDIVADTVTGNFTFTGDSNIFDIDVDATGTYGGDNLEIDVDVTGSGNDMTVKIATAAAATGVDYDAIISGDYNTITSNIDVDNAIFDIDIDGDYNTLDYDADNYAGHEFYLDHTGDYVNFTIDQQSTLAKDYLNIISSGSGTSATNSNICIYQNDAGTVTSC